MSLLNKIALPKDTSQITMYPSAVLLLEETAKRFPQRIALEDDKQSLSFESFQKQAKAIGSFLLNHPHNPRKTAPIGVYLPKSVACVVSFMGILYSGNYYVPMDDNMPTPRLAKMAEHLEPSFIITDEIYKAKLLEIGIPESKLLIYGDIVSHAVNEQKIVTAISRVIDTDPIYIVYTSGSTGVPKGVVISHRSVVDYAHWVVETFDVDETTIFGNQSAFYFDNSVLDMYAVLASGAKLVIIPEIVFQFPAKLLDYIQEKEVSLIFWVPTVMINVANSGALEGYSFKHLKKVLFCGETMPNRQLNIWRKNHPHLLYANLYGPSEITDVCTYYIADRPFEDSDSLPIGIPCRNMGALIINDANELTKVGEIGELCVTGTGLALGYLKAPDLTDKVFVQNPTNTKFMERMYRTGDLAFWSEDGLIMFVGRKDSQIKHRGNRIELGEIETATKSIGGVGNACVLYNQEKEEITLFLEGDDSVTDKTVTKELRKLLPRYMVPSVVHKMDKLPLNANKKIDRVVLRTCLTSRI